MLLAYLGPETMLPVSSALAAIIGALLFGGRYLWAVVSKPFRMFFGRATPASEDEVPREEAGG